MDVVVSDAWCETFPDAHAGVLLLRGVRNEASDAALAAEVQRLEAEVRGRYAGASRADLAELPIVRAYQRHYRTFGQTYHLLGQLESVVMKGRALASPGGVLVSAMFAAEIDHLLLTAGHDLDSLSLPLMLDSSRDGDRFVGISGREHVLRAGDMVMRDSSGIISAVVNGPDQRTRLQPGTTSAVFVTYAPAGIDPVEVRTHLEHIARLVALASPGAVLESLAIYPAV